VRRVRQARYSLGGAGNIVANLAALGVKSVAAAGLIGQDLFGRQMRELLERLGVQTAGLVDTQDDWQTMVYAKPCVGDRELNRMDFGAFGAVSPASIEALEAQLDSAAARVDVVILNQQVPAGVSPPGMIERINAVIGRHPRCRFIVDARHRAELYRNVILKLNAHEAARLLGAPRALDERIPAAAARSLAVRLAERTGQPLFITRGDSGILAVEGQVVHEVPGIQILEATDPVGAGDTAVAAMAAVLGGGGSVLEAARLANIAASITVRKLQTTGTATPQEMRAVGPEPDYVYLPELADDPRQARYVPGTEFEMVWPLPQRLQVRHVLFDHDGTLSTLRQGWEQIMQPMMVKAVLGPRYQDADAGLYHKAVDTVARLIDQTTGVQTLVQMQGLVQLVRQFACVPAEQILDIHGYKKLYNEALLAMVRQRLDKLKRGELDSADFQVKNALPLLRRLHEAGVKLYLASGTDQADVEAEARALGYAELFEGRIFGAIGDVKVEAKREVLHRIIREHGLKGAELLTFGDGPVEMRLTRQVNGVCIGVASDEIRRYGVNAAKRARLIRAGAGLIIPDFSQLDLLLRLLGIGIE
jgi:rfaE bifunctional protein kinase chain/domain